MNLYGDLFVLGLESIMVVFQFSEQRFQLLGGHLFQAGMLLEVQLLIGIHQYYKHLIIICCLQSIQIECNLASMNDDYYLIKIGVAPFIYYRQEAQNYEIGMKLDHGQLSQQYKEPEALAGVSSSSIFSLQTESTIQPSQLSDSLYSFRMNRNICLTLFLLLIIGAISIRIDHLDADQTEASQTDSSAIEWETVEIGNLTDEETHMDEVIRSLLRGLQEFNLTEVQIDNGTLDHFIFEYTNDDNHTISIKGAVEDNTIRFVTPEGREYTETTKTEKWPNGQEFNLTTVSQASSGKKKGRHSFSRSTSFSSFSFIS